MSDAEMYDSVIRKVYAEWRDQATVGACSVSAKDPASPHSAEYLLLCQGARSKKLHVELYVSKDLLRDGTAPTAFRRVVSLCVSDSKGERRGVEVDGLGDLGNAAERLRKSLKL